MQQQPTTTTEVAIKDDLSLLRDAALLKIFSMSPGDEVEVYWGGIFWKAQVTHVDGQGFSYVYENSDTERGHRRYSSLHYLWRFPVKADSQHYTYENMLAMRQPKKRRTGANQA